jgi:hypothetical protein
MPLLARRAASATERTLVYFRMNMYMKATCASQFQPQGIKAYRAAAGLGPTSEMGHRSGSRGEVEPSPLGDRYRP